MPPDARAASRLGARGATLTLVGLVASGPVGLWLVTVTHRSQTIPFFAGIAMMVGYIMIFSALYHTADESQQPRLMVALVAAGVYAALILFNYLCQTTFIPALARANDPALAPIVTTLSLQNPNSLAWAIEMWGYAALGAATWFAAVAFRGSRVERAASWLMIANGVMSATGAVVTAIKLDWVLTPAGFVNYVAWNVLMLILSVLLLVIFRHRAAEIR